MRHARVFGWLSLLLMTPAANGQLATIDPQVRSKPTADHKITTIELTPHFVTTIRLPEPVSSVVVGDPALFQVEHSEHEPELVFVKALTTKDVESNLLISTAKGRQMSFLLISHERGGSPEKVDFVLRYQTAGGFLIEPDAIPFALVAQTANIANPPPAPVNGPTANTGLQPSETLVPASSNRRRRRKFRINPHQIPSIACWNARSKHRCRNCMAGGWKAMKPKATACGPV
jgi:hypothetical protein